MSNGLQDPRNVSITLRDESNNNVVTWVLLNARPRRYATGPLHGRGTDVAIEELVLVCERIDID